MIPIRHHAEKTHTMTAYQKTLLDQLLADLLNEPTHSPLLAKFQMLAAQLKGAMEQSESEHGQPTEAVPTPDADGWVENTGAMPECKISKVRFRDGNEDDYPDPNGYDWSIANVKRDITHYRPA